MHVYDAEEIQRQNEMAQKVAYPTQAVYARDPRAQRDTRADRDTLRTDGRDSARHNGRDGRDSSRLDSYYYNFAGGQQRESYDSRDSQGNLFVAANRGDSTSPRILIEDMEDLPPPGHEGSYLDMRQSRPSAPPPGHEVNDRDSFFSLGASSRRSNRNSLLPPQADQAASLLLNRRGTLAPPSHAPVTAEEHLLVGIHLHELSAGESTTSQDLPPYLRIDPTVQALTASQLLRLSLHHLQKSAEGGHPLGSLLYALSLRHGWGCDPPDPRSGVWWLRRAAERAVGELEEEEKHKGVGPDQESRLAWYERVKAAKHELACIIFQLAVSYYHGYGVTRSRQTGAHYFEVAAGLGDADAMVEIAKCYADGQGVKKDMAKAAHYYRAADKLGFGQVGNQWIWKEKYMSTGGPAGLAL